MLIPEIVVAVPAVPAIGYAVARQARTGASRPRLVLVAAFTTYLAVLVALVFFPMPVGVCELSAPLQLEPLATIRHTLAAGVGSASWWVAVGNVAAFVPLGFLLPLLRSSRRPAVSAAVAACALSVSIEAGQFVAGALIGCGYRWTDVDDVLLNTLGALAGGLAAAAVLARHSPAGRPHGR